MKRQILLLSVSLTLVGCASNPNSDYRATLDDLNSEISRIERLKEQERIAKYESREYLYCEDHGCGIKRVNGENLLPAEYKRLTPLFHAIDRGYLAFTYNKDGSRSGLMDYSYKKITPPIFNSGKIPPVVQKEDYIIYGETIDGTPKKGVAGTTGVIFPPKFHNIHHVSKDIFTFQNQENGKWGLIRRDGKIILDEQLDQSASAYENQEDGETVFKFINEGKTYIVNESGDTLLTLDDSKISFSVNNKLVYQKNAKYGLMTVDGKIILQPQFDDMSVFGTGEDKYIHAEKGSQHGCYNTETDTWEKVGNYEDLRCPNIYFHGAAKIGGLWYIYNKDGELDQSRGFDFVGPESIYDNKSKGYLSVSINGKNGIIDANGRVVIPIQYDRIEGFNPDEEVALVRHKDNYDKTVYTIVSKNQPFMGSIKGRTGVEEVGDDIYAFYNGFWFRAGDMKDVVYYDLKLKRQIRP
jgi:hypothetical protein